ncbi:hypothetical protein [uncultured Parvibaculum sp.]|uniref:hypothetical protein n=1 Tax=uncultured Parvibaculum sp. TaxID=291828 RepID=UPI0030DA090D|tara:strand:- start:28584 stop:29090 length:507 start_codon:yes stop_codon:yes gene_type:complete
MGFPSMNEDIEKLRAEREHFAGGMDRILGWLSAETSRADLARLEQDTLKLKTEIHERLTALKCSILAEFDEMHEKLKDGQFFQWKKNKKLEEKLRKTQSSRDELQKQIKSAVSQKERSEQTIHRLNDELAEERRRTATLQAANSKLRDSLDGMSEWKDLTSQTRKLKG